MDVSIIIVNYNCANYILNCLQSIHEQVTGVVYEIIIVDNASTDNSLELIGNSFHDIKIIRNNINEGFGKANNIAAKHARGKYLFFLNPDTILLNDSVKIFCDFFNKNNHEKIGCIGGNLLDDKRQPANVGGHFPSIFQLFSDIGFRFFYSDYYKKKLTLMLTVDMTDNNNIDYVCGADLFITKNVFVELNGFDEDYFLYYEDTDLCFRLVQKGYKNCIVPEARVMHLESVSTTSGFNGKINLGKFRFLESGKQIFYKKSYGKAHVFCVKILTVFYLMSRCIAHLANPIKYFRLSLISLCTRTKS